MGTSGAYGGSGNQAWTTARELLDQLPVTSADAGSSDTDGSDGDESDALAALAGALADALAGDDSTLTVVAPIATPLSSLLPRRSAGGGGGGGGAGGAGGTVRGEGGSGRVGGGSRRSVTGSVARGGAAIGGAYALRAGDRAALAEIGLDLDALRAMGPRSQCAAILAAVLGEAGHPDETALRTAAAEQLKAIIVSGTPPSEADALRGFISAFVFQMCLVELRANLAKGVIDVATATHKEGRLRRYLDRRVAGLTIPTTGAMGIADFSAQADKLAREAIALLRAK